MTDLIVVPQTTEWHRLKRLVLDSVCSRAERRDQAEGDGVALGLPLLCSARLSCRRRGACTSPGGPRRRVGLSLNGYCGMGAAWLFWNTTTKGSGLFVVHRNER